MEARPGPRRASLICRATAISSSSRSRRDEHEPIAIGARYCQCRPGEGRIGRDRDRRLHTPRFPAATREPAGGSRIRAAPSVARMSTLRDQATGSTSRSRRGRARPDRQSSRPASRRSRESASDEGRAISSSRSTCSSQAPDACTRRSYPRNVAVRRCVCASIRSAPRSCSASCSSASSSSSSRRATVRRLPPQLVVEARHLGEETGPQPPGFSGRGLSCGRPDHHVAFVRGQAGGRAVQPPVKVIVKLLACREGRRRAPDGPPELKGRAARGNQHHAATPAVGRRPRARVRRWRA